jgi:hypothetical protein
MSYVWAIVGIAFVLAMWVILFYGFMGWGDVGETYFAPLRHRHALVSKLIETVRGHSAHDRGSLEAVAQALGMATLARGLQQTAQTEHALSAALRELFARTSADPAFGADSDFQQLHAKILEIEPDINGVLQYCTSPRVTRWPW